MCKIVQEAELEEKRMEMYEDEGKFRNEKIEERVS